MALVVLVLWLFTAGAGIYLLVTSNLARTRPAAAHPAPAAVTAQAAPAAQPPQPPTPLPHAARPAAPAAQPPHPAPRRRPPRRPSHAGR